MSSESRTVYYVWSPELISECDRLPAVRERASMVHQLIEAYGLLGGAERIDGKCCVVRSEPATDRQLTIFHDKAYIEHLKNLPADTEDYDITKEDEEFGLAYDCEVVPGLERLVRALGGGSVSAARALLLRPAEPHVALNWCGGWHHARRGGAEGFCYVNDIALAIETLRLHPAHRAAPLLYLDLDVHHGDGVEAAYARSRAVVTVSLHRREPGFYPGGGGARHVGLPPAQGCALNVPLAEGYSDDTFIHAFDKVWAEVWARFEFSAVVVQCGADALAGDALGGANLTERAYTHAVTRVLAAAVPTLLLGGGGYNCANSARLWCALTACALGVRLGEEVPEHALLPRYGPAYTLPVERSRRPDTNTPARLNHTLTTLTENLDKYVGKKT